MKLTSVKGIVSKAMMTALAAGTLLFAAPTRSQAQVAVGLRFGRPARVYIAPARAYVGPAPYWVRRDAYLRQLEWERAHRVYRPRFYR